MGKKLEQTATYQNVERILKYMMMPDTREGLRNIISLIGDKRGWCSNRNEQLAYKCADIILKENLPVKEGECEEA